MAQRPRNPQSATARWLSITIVVALALGVIVLAYLAFQHARMPASTGTARPAPTITASPVAETPTTSPTPAPIAQQIDAPGPAERFLSVGASAIWRATAGACGTAEPLLERSTDGGETWADVTPRYLGIGQILSLDAFAGSEAEIVALTGDDCELQALRTFTQGRFWEPNDDTLAAATYIDPRDAASVVTPDGAVAAPCATPWGLRAEGGTTALICDGTAYTLGSDDTWSPGATDAVALAVVDGGVVTASAATAGSPAAVADSTDGVLLWSGGALTLLP